MKRLSWLNLLPLLPFVLILAGCDGLVPGATATLAPTAAPIAAEGAAVPTAVVAVTSAAAPTTTANATVPATAAAGDAAGQPTATAVQPTLTPPPPPTPTPEPSPTAAPPPTYSYEVINNYPHDPEAFTQGLLYYEGGFYEGTGRWGESTLREVALESGTVLRSQPLEPQYFGEGIALVGDKIYQLTWQEQTGFVYDRATFEPLQTFSYPHEGWGITYDGSRLIVSDGTADIRFWDPATLQETGRITVRDQEGPVNRLNELEYVNGEIWANIWLTDLIARISPETGEVLGYIDLTGLLDARTLTQPVDVLNGIAHDPETGRPFVTGKLWPTLFEIEVVPAP